MMYIKATCTLCEGTGYSMDFGNSTSVFCKQCEGVGVLILTAEDWDIELGYKQSAEKDNDK